MTRTATANPFLTDTTLVPKACGIAFKEWAGVCAALAEGRQSLILRKGGIAESSEGFVPEHPAFWLYPTHVHQAEQGLRVTGPLPPVIGADRVAIEALATVAGVAYIDHDAVLPALADLHVWTEETVAKRFHYRACGLWVLGVRVYRRPAPFSLAVIPEHAGCKSWVPLDPPPSTAELEPALDEPEFLRRMEQLWKAIGSHG